MAAGETSDYPDLTDLTSNVAGAAAVKTDDVCITLTQVRTSHASHPTLTLSPKPQPSPNPNPNPN